MLDLFESICHRNSTNTLDNSWYFLQGKQEENQRLLLDDECEQLSNLGSSEGISPLDIFKVRSYIYIYTYTPKKHNCIPRT